MFLYRGSNNVYFTRICLAKTLRDKGFPFDIKISLLTRDKAQAVIRNIDVAGTLKKHQYHRPSMTLFVMLIKYLTV
ncbi:hypothetical protein [Shewanella sp. KT0246]|uniref:hypothetical protein n=1 Tax=Shewanella sp. KT0246 TaxID=2815912 RepID=UPI001BBD3DD9|nr:hypothetical protein [Shewanella sp. KT0246]GIU52807.1 hypothetical protein TUM4249_24780 [Shewanella sp. KT0246]